MIEMVKALMDSQVIDEVRSSHVTLHQLPKDVFSIILTI